MTHTALADLYLGDISSQVYEFLRTPRPCLFLNRHAVPWQTDENYAHWRFGPVLTGIEGLIGAVDRSFVEHSQWRGAQEQGVARTFLPCGGARAAAKAIADYLARSARCSAGYDHR